MKKLFRCRKIKRPLNRSGILFLLGCMIFCFYSSAEEDAEETSPENPELLVEESTGEKLEASNKASSESANEEDPTAIGLSTREKAELIPPSTRAATQNLLNQITNLEFSMVGEISRINVSFRFAPRYREVVNTQVKQIVYFFENTQTPQKLQRAYDTTEFSSPVALFTLLQMPKNEPPLTKLIIQLRDDKAPNVTTSERGMQIDFPAYSEKREPRIVVGDGDGGSVEENLLQGDKIFTGKIIQRLEVKNSDIQDVLRFIAKSSGYNIVISDDVKGPVGTLSLENVPWDQAFALLLQSKKLGYVKQGNVIRVGTLDSLAKEKEEMLRNEEAKVKVEPLKTVLVPISYAKADELAPKAQKFLTAQRGSIDTDTRTNTIIIKDIDSVVTRIQKLLMALDTPPPLVSISAKIVEMAGSLSRSFGFGNIRANLDILSGVNFDEQITLQSLSGDVRSSVSTIRAPDFARMEAIFALGEVEDKAKVLANPTVTVVANRTGKIDQGVTTFIPGAPAIVGGGQTVATIQTVTASLTLTVTPIVSNDGSISMKVNVNNSFPRGAQRIDNRTVDTEVIVDNGDTVVLGGVFKNDYLTGKEGVPLLKDIPILGFFFSKNTLSDTRNEIFIFLTPKILNAAESFRRTL